MFSKAYLVVCAFTAIAMAQQMPPATCYPGGPNLAAPSSDCSQFVNTFCDSVSSIKTRVSDSIGHCYNLSNDRVCDFIAWNTYPNDAPPSPVSCRNALNNVISTCTYGGYGQVRPNTYTFTVDINRGACGHDVHAGS